MHSNVYLFIDQLQIFHVAKRHYPFEKWEPFFIGTHDDPLFDERLSWEGHHNKMTMVTWYFILTFKKI